jgi:hypothetical protein
MATSRYVTNALATKRSANETRIVKLYTDNTKYWGIDADGNTLSDADWSFMGSDVQLKMPMSSKTKIIFGVVGIILITGVILLIRHYYVKKN